VARHCAVIIQSDLTAIWGYQPPFLKQREVYSGGLDANASGMLMPHEGAIVLWGWLEKLLTISA